MVRRDQGELDLALRDFSKAIDLNANRAWFYDERALVWFEKREFARARADLENVIIRRPRNARAYCKRGDTWNGEEQTERAIADYSRSIKLDPKVAVVYVKRGDARAECKKLTWLSPTTTARFGSTRGLRLPSATAAECG